MATKCKMSAFHFCLNVPASIPTCAQEQITAFMPRKLPTDCEVSHSSPLVEVLLVHPTRALMSSDLTLQSLLRSSSTVECLPCSRYRSQEHRHEYRLALVLLVSECETTGLKIDELKAMYSVP